LFNFCRERPKDLARLTVFSTEVVLSTEGTSKAMEVVSSFWAGQSLEEKKRVESSDDLVRRRPEREQLDMPVRENPNRLEEGVGGRQAHQ